MKQQAIIGIDIGTTSTKAVAFGVGHAEVLCQHDVGYGISSPKAGYAEQNPEEVFQAVLTTLKNVAGQLQQAGHTLAGVSFSSAMHSLIAMNAAGKALINCLIWADTRSKAYADSLKNSTLGHTIYLETGTPLHPMSPLPKLCWLREHEPEVFRQTYKFIGIKEFVLFRLFGVYKTDYSIASATGLFNIFTLQWHTEALQVAGITPALLPEPVPPTYTFSKLLPEYAALLQIADTVPFVIGASDGCLANLGSGALRPGDAVVTIGTSGAVRVLAGHPATDDQERIFSYILSPGYFVLGGAMNNGGVVLNWFRDNFYEFETAQEADSYEVLCRKAAAIPAGADGLLFLPYLLGERAPVWDASARASFIGVHYTHTRDHFLRALLEGVIFGVYSVGQALEQTVGPVSAIYANGGFSRCPTWVQMLADVFNKEVHLSNTAEGSALGAAIMGMYALGMIQQLEDAAHLTTTRQTFIPRPDIHQVYQQSYARYETLYAKLKDLYS
ncbi:gluconokinase [Pontibacter chitinilyticus]|uniref:gluconokinase n=1 Tax=Pontibacter chitinilyticus TaxID=2674989 RepID=UPI00321BE0C2